MDYQTLNLLFRCNKEFNREKIRLQELSDTECMICSYIFSHEGCSQGDVSVALKTDKTTIGKALASLEKKNCVIRVQDEADKRIKRLSLTETGHEKVSELVDLHNHWLREIMTCLSEEEQQQFEDYCERLLAAAEKLTSNNRETTNEPRK
ncbi:MAG: MarR family transcriptional regulator [Clostridiales bacterium]|nr:MarR family transcriptional regulator [Candidatus Cacconaster stercorequi]